MCLSLALAPAAHARAACTASDIRRPCSSLCVAPFLLPLVCVAQNEILELRSLGLRRAMNKYKLDMRDENDGGRAHTSGPVSRAAAGSAFFM